MATETLDSSFPATTPAPIFSNNDEIHENLKRAVLLTITRSTTTYTTEIDLQTSTAADSSSATVTSGSTTPLVPATLHTGGLSPGAVAGIVCSIFAVVLLLLLFWCCHRRQASLYNSYYITSVDDFRAYPPMDLPQIPPTLPLTRPDWRLEKDEEGNMRWVRPASYSSRSGGSLSSVRGQWHGRSGSVRTGSGRTGRGRRYRERVERVERVRVRSRSKSRHSRREGDDDGVFVVNI